MGFSSGFFSSTGFSGTDCGTGCGVGSGAFVTFSTISGSGSFLGGSAFGGSGFSSIFGAGIFSVLEGEAGSSRPTRLTSS